MNAQPESTLNHHQQSFLRWLDKRHAEIRRTVVAYMTDESTETCPQWPETAESTDDAPAQPPLLLDVVVDEQHTLINRDGAPLTPWGSSPTRKEAGNITNGDLLWHDSRWHVVHDVVGTTKDGRCALILREINAEPGFRVDLPVSTLYWTANFADRDAMRETVLAPEPMEDAGVVDDFDGDDDGLNVADLHDEHVLQTEPDPNGPDARSVFARDIKAGVRTHFTPQPGAQPRWALVTDVIDSPDTEHVCLMMEWEEAHRSLPSWLHYDAVLRVPK